MILESLLDIQGLQIVAGEEEKEIVGELNLKVSPLSIKAIVGGSGSGKTTTGLSVLRLLPPALKVKKGKIFLKGEDVLKLPFYDMQRIRGKEIGMVFQEPLNAFNPVFTIGYQIDEALKTHTHLTKEQRQKRMLELLEKVELKEPQRIISSYPHQLSGGMRQRAMIAMAMALGPSLIIADEPTSSLDVTLQAKIIELFKKLKDEFKISILLITHDLGLVEHLADEVAILYEGHIVEEGKTKQILNSPRHFFTEKLMKAARG